ncbi:MAG: molecular chaperone [Acidobacteriota bacterium]
MNDTAVDLARANVYRYLGVACLPPDEPRFELLSDDRFRPLVSAAINWMREDPRFHPQRLGPGELHPCRLDSTSLFPDGENPGKAYLDAFGHSISKDCPPYENEYCANRDITFRCQRLADIAGFYRAFGLGRSAEARERLDHLSFEAEFMQILIARQLHAIEAELGESCAEVCRRAQRRFFIEHLGWWLPAFGLQLGARAPSPLYAGLARLVRALAAAERAVFQLSPFTELPAARPDTYKPEGDGFGCGLDGDGGCMPVAESVFSADPGR